MANETLSTRAVAPKSWSVVGALELRKIKPAHVDPRQHPKGDADVQRMTVKTNP